MKWSFTVFDVILIFLSRLALVMLFLPFSAWDKIVNFRGAVAQAREIGVGPLIGAVMILTGLAIEIVCSLGVLTGVADRLAALILAGYCGATALLYKRWWSMQGGIFQPGDDDSRRAAFFDFWKNLAVAGGFAAIALGPTVRDVPALFDAPLSSTQPYAQDAGS